MRIKMAIMAFIGAAQMIFAHSAVAKGEELPRGPEIQARAGACGVGEQHGEYGAPLGQLGKAGAYNSLCKDLTDAEICLAFVKAHMTSNGVVSEAYKAFQPKAAFCVEHFRSLLVNEEEESE